MCAGLSVPGSGQDAVAGGASRDVWERTGRYLPKLGVCVVQSAATEGAASGEVLSMVAMHLSGVARSCVAVFACVGVTDDSVITMYLCARV